MNDRVGKYVRIQPGETEAHTDGSSSDAESDQDSEIGQTDDPRPEDEIDEADSEDNPDPEDDSSSEDDSNLEDEVAPHDTTNPVNEVGPETAQQPPAVTVEMFTVLQKAIVDLAQLISEKPWEQSATTSTPSEGGVDSSTGGDS